MHLGDRLRGRSGAVGGVPHAQPFEELDAAERQRERARVARHVLVERAARRTPRCGRPAATVRPAAPAPAPPVRPRPPPGSTPSNRSPSSATSCACAATVPCWTWARPAVLFAAPRVSCGSQGGLTMALMDFIKKQFIDVIQWTEDERRRACLAVPDGRHGDPERRDSLTVRESAARSCSSTKARSPTSSARATTRSTTNTLPVLTYLKNWDKLFQSRRSRATCYFFSTRQQLDQQAGVPRNRSPIRDKDFGAVRLRAFGNYSVSRRPSRRSLSTPRSPARATDLHGGRRTRRPAARRWWCRTCPMPSPPVGHRRSWTSPRTRSSSRRVLKDQLTGPAFAEARAGARGLHGPERFVAGGTAEGARPEASAWAWSATTWASSSSTRPRQAIPEIRRRQQRWRRGVAGDAMGLGPASHSAR